MVLEVSGPGSLSHPAVRGLLHPDEMIDMKHLEVL